MKRQNEVRGKVIITKADDIIDKNSKYLEAESIALEERKNIIRQFCNKELGESYKPPTMSKIVNENNVDNDFIDSLNFTYVKTPYMKEIISKTSSEINKIITIKNAQLSIHNLPRKKKKKLYGTRTSRRNKMKERKKYNNLYFSKREIDKEFGKGSLLSKISGIPHNIINSPISVDYMRNRVRFTDKSIRPEFFVYRCQHCDYINESQTARRKDLFCKKCNKLTLQAE